MKIFSEFYCAFSHLDNPIQTLKICIVTININTYLLARVITGFFQFFLMIRLT